MEEVTTSESERSLRLEILEQVQKLATASLGLVAALAWNDAVQALFQYIFGAQSNLAAKFFYAILVTVLIVVVTFRLSKIIARLKR